MIDIDVPIKTSSTNTKLRVHWRTNRRTAKREREAVFMMLRSGGVRALGPTEAATVYLTRNAPRALDDDNLRGALKAVRDEVAKALGVDDRDARVAYEYRQAKAKAPSVRIVVESKCCASHPACRCDLADGAFG